MRGMKAGFAFGEFGELLRVEVAAGRVKRGGKMDSIVVVKPKEEVGAHGKNCSTHVRGQLIPELLSGCERDSVFPGFGD